jgi:RNA polymerase sigma-70 factor (ECF subfamily)
VTGGNDEALLAALQQGDERVFSDLVERWNSAMLRMALVHLDSLALAEEVVQEAWLTVLRSLHGRRPRRANALDLSDTNQRVLLHRARTRIRQAIEDYFGATEPT